VPSALLVACAALTAARLTRLTVRDDFPPIRWARDRLVDKGPEWIVDLSTCPWCASGWVSIGVVALLWLAPGVAAPVLTAGAVWALSSTAAWWQGRVEDADEQEAEDEAGDETLQMYVGPNGKVEV
jgi:hypothetical protein